MKQTIKVLHTEWSDGWGGQEIRIVNEMIALREKGIELFLACREDAQIKSKAQAHGFKVFTLPFRGNADIKTLWGLMRIIRKENIDIVNTHSGKDTWVGGLAAKFTGTKFIRTRHLSNPIRSSRMNFINELADFVFTTGESVRDNMIRNNRIDPHKILSVPTGIDDTVYDPQKYDRQACRKKFGIEDDVTAVGIVAVLRQFKRHDVFVEMAHRIVQQFPDKKLQFLIAGEGPQRKHIEKSVARYRMEDHITLLGHVANVPEFLSAIDIFTLTSDSKEGVPQSVMQALLMEKAVIATDAGSTRDLLEHDNFILVPAENNMEILVDKMALLIENEALRDTYAARARAYVKAHFSQSVMSETIFKVYRELLDR